LQQNKIDLYCRWLYQTAGADRKPRLLFLGSINVTSISLFIDRLKQVIVKAPRWLKKGHFLQDFLMATDPVTFIIRIRLPKAFQHEDICLDNSQTKEGLLTISPIVIYPSFMYDEIDEPALFHIAFFAISVISQQIGKILMK
jgi:hypothetical protein